MIAPTVNQRTATLENVFVGEGRHHLSLPIGPLQDLETILDLGLPAILNRFLTLTWRSKDVIHTIRLGLIGGGMSPRDALDLVESHVVSAFLGEYAKTASVLLQAAMFGIADDPVGEPQAATTTETPATE